MRASLIAASLLALTSHAFAHGMSDIDGRVDVAPAGAGVGDTVSLSVRLVELAPGAAAGAAVRAKVVHDDGEELVNLRPAGTRTHQGRFVLPPGTSDLRVFIQRGDKREFAMWGIDARSGRLHGHSASGDIFFVPAGRLDAIPLLDNVFGALTAVGLLVGMGFLLRRRQATAADVSGGASTTTLALAALGAVAMPFGAYWDLSFHLAAGRESFFSPPHYLIYGGILAALVAVLLGIGRKTSAVRWRDHLARDPAALAAAIALASQLSSAPFDELWHAVFGLDVSVWSPPHGVLIMGGFAACVALAAVRVSKASRSLAALRAFALGGAMLIGNFFLAEFEFGFPSWHVSQARPSFVYPAFLALFALMVGLVARRALTARYAATLVGTVFIALRLLVYPLLDVAEMGHVPELSPWLVLPLAIGVALDVMPRGRVLHIAPSL